MKTIASEFSFSKRILYIEAHKDCRQMLVFLLEKDGYTVTTATSISDAMTLVKREQFDLYIVASRYSDGRGVDLCQQIRAFEPLTPILFFSGESYPSDIAAGLAAGAQQYLIKPMGLSTIDQTIAELLTEAKNAPPEVQREDFQNQEDEVGRGYSNTPVL
jgi:DNA-binding response OmpR family regulator